MFAKNSDIPIRFIILLAIGIYVLLMGTFLYSCDGQKNKDSIINTSKVTETTIVGAGATFPQPLFQAWDSEYLRLKPTVNILYEGVGSGEGIKRFIDEKVDFGASDAAMKDSEIQQVPRGVNLIPITAGMIVLAYNIHGFDGDLNLPRDVYTKIFLGEITRWDDPLIVAANPGVKLPKRSIQVIARSDSSGTTFVFTKHLAAISEKWKTGPGVGKEIDWPNALTGQGNAGVAQMVKTGYGSIGYMEYAFAKRLGLKVASLENKSKNYIYPSPESGTLALTLKDDNIPVNLRMFIPDPLQAGAYPIASYSWLLLYKKYSDDIKRNMLKENVIWRLTSGQGIARDMGYIPLPPSIADRSKKIVENIF